MSKRIRLQMRDKDDWIIEELEKIVATKNAMGIETTLGIEVARILRQHLVDDYDSFLERAKDLGLFETWKHKVGEPE